MDDPFQKTTEDSSIIAFAGDVMIGRLVNEVLETRDPLSIWGDVLPLWHRSNLNIINFEAALTTCPNAVPKVFNFKSDPKNVECLTEAHIDIVNLANNHILDYTEKGLYDTLDTLDRAGIKRVGAGRNLNEARQPMIVEVNETKIGILGCTDNEPSWKAGSEECGTNYIQVSDTATLCEDIAALRKQVDILIVSIHWGPNMVERPSQAFQHFAHQIIDAGADILHGHSAHLFQGIELYNKKLIMYDTGDFVDDYAVDPYLRNDRSFLFLVEVCRKKILSIRLIPTYISNFSVNVARAEEKEVTCKRMRALSAKFLTEMTEFDWGLFTSIS